jgi:hypothetical protein
MPNARSLARNLTPSPGATPYQAGVMAMAHAMLGALESYAMAAFITP